MPNPGAETETKILIENNTETLSGKFSKAIGSTKNGTKYVGSVLVHFGQEYNQGLFRGGYSSSVGEKLTIRWGIFTDENYILHKLWELVTDLAKKDNRLFSSCQI